MLHLVDEVDLLESGVRGDRRFYLVTERGRLVSNKDHGPLQLVRADYDADADVLVAALSPTASVVDGEVERGDGGRDDVPQAAAHGPRGRRAVGRGGVGARSGSRFGSSSPSCRRPTAVAAARRPCSRRRRSAGSRASSASTRSTTAASG